MLYATHSSGRLVTDLLCSGATTNDAAAAAGTWPLGLIFGSSYDLHWRAGNGITAKATKERQNKSDYAGFLSR
jgi:hypothetical protein